MRDAYAKVAEFHRACGLPIADTADCSDPALNDLRMDLIAEEARELLLALQADDPIAVADALADLAYVTLGAALCFGIDLPAVFDEVHRSNMSKLGPDGKPVLNEYGKVTKGPNYSPADIESVLLNGVSC